MRMQGGRDWKQVLASDEERGGEIEVKLHVPHILEAVCWVLSMMKVTLVMVSHRAVLDVTRSWKSL